MLLKDSTTNSRCAVTYTLNASISPLTLQCRRLPRTWSLNLERAGRHDQLSAVTRRGSDAPRRRPRPTTATRSQPATLYGTKDSSCAVSMYFFKNLEHSTLIKVERSRFLKEHIETINFDIPEKCTLTTASSLRPASVSHASLRVLTPRVTRASHSLAYPGEE